MPLLKKPSYFPNKPIEDIVDGNALAWLSILNEGDATWEITPQRELKIEFTNGEEGHEVGKHMDLIPEGFGPKRSGRRIKIPVPSEFANWLRES